MFTIKVPLNENSYDIVIGHHILKGLPERLRALKLGSDAVIVTHPVVRKWHGRALETCLRRQGFTVKTIEVPSGEKSKSAGSALKVIKEIASYGAGKNIFLLAFGGGVIGDLTGYVAAVYRRGIPYVQVPTTFLAQIDSAIGGKVAIDLPFGKNLIGAFYQPRLVWSDVSLLTTLDRRQIRNGLSEAVKYGVISDRNLFDLIERNAAALLKLDTKVVKEVVIACSRIKARIVSADERETRGIRTILNFGHTIGHAIETADQYRHYHHGEAVALGMKVVAKISQRLKLFSSSEASRLERLLTAVGLPQRIQKVSTARVLKYMAYDKKFLSRKNRFVLATGIGSVKVVDGVPLPAIRSAVTACR